MGDRAVDCARLESVCAARHQGFESPPIRQSSRAQSRDLAAKPTVNTSAFLDFARNDLLLLAHTSSRQHLQILSHLHHARAWQHPTEIHSWINNAIPAQHRSRINHGVASDL